MQIREVCPSCFQGIIEELTIPAMLINLGNMQTQSPALDLFELMSLVDRDLCAVSISLT